MSVESLSALPLQAGHAVAAASGRAAIWAISSYMRAPLRNTALLALVSMSALAGSNALFNQSGEHPAPLFSDFATRTSVARAEPAPIPMERPAQLMQADEPAPAPAATRSTALEPASTVIPDEPVGNPDVFEVQRKLAAFKLFDAKVDGFYGPRTASAIRAFEEKVGLPPTGRLTPEIVERIKSTPITAEPAPATVAPAATAEPVAMATPVETAAPQVTEAALPPPTLSPATTLPPPAPLTAAEPAGSAAGVTGLTMSSQTAGEAPTRRVVQTVAVDAEPTASAATGEASAAVITTPIGVARAATDPQVVSAVQRGLASLGFLHGQIDGVAGEATAKAIRNFEVYYNYNVTGRITPELINLLQQNGAVI